MKKIISVLLVLSMLLSICALSFPVAAEEVEIFNKIALSYTRDVFENKNAFLAQKVQEGETYVLPDEAWGISAYAGFEDYAFDETYFMREDEYGFGVTAENGYATTLNGIPYQFGVIASAENGIQNENNVIHSGDFTDDIVIPVDEAPYNNLYMIAWSSVNDVAATITYLYADGTTGTEENIVKFKGGTKNPTLDDYIALLPNATNPYVQVWQDTLTAEGKVSVKNARVIQHKLTPDSTKILKSVKISTTNEELNIFALTGATSTATYKANLDAIKARFETEKLSEAELVAVEEEAEALVELLKEYEPETTYLSEIQALIEARRLEIEEEATIITEFDIVSPFNLTYTRDVMEDGTEYLTQAVDNKDGTYSYPEGAWTLILSVQNSGTNIAFDENIFMTKTGANQENGYKATLNNVLYQFGPIVSEVNGTAGSPNVINNGDNETIIIPVEENTYENLYLAAWSYTDKNAATITYTYTDGTTGTDENIAEIKGGRKASCESIGDNEYTTEIASEVRLWRASNGTDKWGAYNGNIVEHKLTPDSTKLLKSVTIQATSKDANIFALTGTTKSTTIKAWLDNTVERFSAEELTSDQLTVIENDTKALIDILKGYDLKPTYEAQIAELVAERREELKDVERVEGFNEGSSTPIELNLFEDIFMVFEDMSGKDGTPGLYYAEGGDNTAYYASKYPYKGLTFQGTTAIYPIAWPQNSRTKGSTWALSIDNPSGRNYTASINDNVASGNLVLKEDSRYDFTVADTTYHLGLIDAEKKTGNIFFPGQPYDNSLSTDTAIKGEAISSYYEIDEENRVVSGTYPVNMTGLKSVNILASTFVNHQHNKKSGYLTGKTYTELVPVTVTYSDGETEELYIASGSIYNDFEYSIRAADKGEAVEVSGTALVYTNKTAEDTIDYNNNANTTEIVKAAVPSGEAGIGIDYLGEMFEVNGNKILMPAGSKLLASGNRAHQSFNGNYSSAHGYTYSYEVPVNINKTVSTIKVGNPVALNVYNMKNLFGEENVVQTNYSPYIKFASDDTKDYYLSVYSNYNTDDSYAGIFAMTAVAPAVNDLIAELEAELGKAEADKEKVNELTTALKNAENFIYETDLSEDLRKKIDYVSSSIVINESATNVISVTADIKGAESGVAVVMFYNDEGELITTKTASVENEVAVDICTKPEGTVKIKAYLWESLVSLKPLAQKTEADSREYALDNIYYNGAWVTDCEEELSIAFLGDSLCAGDSTYNADGSFTESSYHWPSIICNYFEEKTGRETVKWNAAIGGTKSDTAAELLNDLVITKNPDIVVIENANDISADYIKGYKAVENIIRTLSKLDKQPVIILYHPAYPYIEGAEWAYNSKTYDKQLELYNGKDAIAEKYNVASINFGTYFNGLIEANASMTEDELHTWYNQYYPDNNIHCARDGYTLMGTYFVETLDADPSAYLKRHTVPNKPVYTEAEDKYSLTMADDGRFTYSGFTKYLTANDTAELEGAAAIKLTNMIYPFGALAQASVKDATISFTTSAEEVTLVHTNPSVVRTRRPIEIRVDGVLKETVTADNTNTNNLQSVKISLDGNEHTILIKTLDGSLSSTEGATDEGRIFNFRYIVEKN